MGTSLAKPLPATCEDTLTFLQVAHAVLPLVLLAWHSAKACAPSAGLAASAARRTGGNGVCQEPLASLGPAGPDLQTQQGWQLQRVQLSQRWWRQPGATPSHGVWYATDAWMRVVCGSWLGPLGRLAFLLWLTTILYVIANF